MKIEHIHSDKRGCIRAITENFIKTPEVAIMQTKQGYARGGCIHSRNREHLCVIEGMINYVYGDNKKELILLSGESISIDPNTPHYFVALTDCTVAEWGADADEKVEKHEAFRKIVMEINEK